MGDGDPLHQRGALRRSPVAHDGKANRAAVVAGDEIGVLPIRQRGAMPCFVPASDEHIESGRPLGLHDERDHGFIGAPHLQRGRRRRSHRHLDVVSPAQADPFPSAPRGAFRKRGAECAL
jgi:hypothetical protein